MEEKMYDKKGPEAIEALTTIQGIALDCMGRLIVVDGYLREHDLEDIAGSEGGRFSHVVLEVMNTVTAAREAIESIYKQTAIL